jgi:hypothetical protein
MASGLVKMITAIPSPSSRKRRLSTNGLRGGQRIISSKPTSSPEQLPVLLGILSELGFERLCHSLQRRVLNSLSSIAQAETMEANCAKKDDSD